MAALGAAWTGITHLALSHFHPDHIGDIPLLMMAWRYGTLPPRAAPLEIIGPVGTVALLDHLAGAFGAWMREPGYPVSVREIPAGTGADLGDGVRLETRKVPHTDESIAYSITSGGARVVYTGDTGFDETLGSWAAGCDVLLAECSLPGSMGIPTHLTPEACGRLAALARPRLLALTHFYPPVEQVDILGIVAESYDGQTVVATDGWAVHIEET